MVMDISYERSFNPLEVRPLTHEEFEPLVRTYSDTVYRVAYQALKNRADAEDVMQTVLLKLFEREEPFASRDHIRAWLIHVTVNESRKLLRTVWRRRVLPLEEWRDAPAFERPEQSELFAAVMALPVKYRAAVHLHYYEGYTLEEIAGFLKISPSAVSMRLHRARKLLRNSLEDDYGSEIISKNL